MSKNTKHLIASGCSYTAHDGTETHGFNKSWSYRILDQLDESLWPVKLHNVAITGVGNYTVSMNVIAQVEHLLSQGISSDDIVAVVQWTGLFRPTKYNEDHTRRYVPFSEIDADSPLKQLSKKYHPGFVDSASNRDEKFWKFYFINYYTTPAAFIDNLNVILKTQWYFQSKGIQYKMFNGWDIFTSPDGEPGDHGKDFMLRPNQFSDEGGYTNVDNRLLKDMYPWSEVFWDMLDFDNYWFFDNQDIKYGGLTQWVQNNIKDPREWYMSFPDDVHPSNKAHKKFSTHVITPLVIKMLEEKS